LVLTDAPVAASYRPLRSSDHDHGQLLVHPVVGELRIAVEPEVLAGQRVREVVVRVDDRVPERAPVVVEVATTVGVPVAGGVTRGGRADRGLVSDVQSPVVADLRVRAWSNGVMPPWNPSSDGGSANGCPKCAPKSTLADNMIGDSM
jgi:hypothetical protein